MASYYTYNSSNFKDRNTFTSTVKQPNYGVKRYFSSLDTDVYFGSQIIDEIVAIDFVVNEPKLPIYGYNSFFPNRMIQGRRTVQGTFAINFTQTHYLLNVLNSIEDSILANDYDALVYRCEGNSSLFEKQFDITISYGYANTNNPTYNASMQTLLGVQIVDYRQALDTDGNPILDMYSFIAKDIRIGDGVNNTDVSSESTNTDVEEDIDTSTSNEIVVASVLEINDFNARCENCLFGVLLEPLYEYNTQGYYVTLNIDLYNTTSTEIKNLKMALSDNNGINTVIIPQGSISGTKGTYKFELKESYRDIGVKLMNSYLDAVLQESYYACDCNISFDLVANGQTHKIQLDTILNLVNDI